MWAQGNWNQMTLDAAAYQNMSHELVDWATLAQQWIRMKEEHETVVLNLPGMIPNPMSNIAPPQQPFQNSFDSGVTAGEAPMDVENEEAVSSNDWSWSPQPSQQISNWLPHPSMFTPRMSMPQGFPVGPASLPIVNPPQVFHPTPTFQPRVPLPPTICGSSDEDSSGPFSSMSNLDAAKRKSLPAWIREGLEKMEREKQKKEEREKFLQEREIRRQKDLEMRLNSEPGIVKSRFDDSDDDNSDSDSETVPQQEPDPVSAQESVENMMNIIRRLMTEVLLEVTTEEIKSTAMETFQNAKVKSRQVQPSLPSKTLTTKLGLDQYGSDSEDDEDSGHQSSDRQSKDKIENEPASEGFQSENESGLKLSNSDVDGNKKDELKDGSKVDMDISGKLQHGLEKLGPEANATEVEIKNSVVRDSRSSSKSSDQRKLESSSKRSRNSDRRRSRSRERHYSRRHRSRSSSRRNKSRDRKRSRSRQRHRSRDRKRSSSSDSRRRRSRSSDRRRLRR